MIIKFDISILFIFLYFIFLLRTLLQQPSRIKEVIEARLDNITWCLNPRNKSFISLLNKCMSTLSYISVS